MLTPGNWKAPEESDEDDEDVSELDELPPELEDDDPLDAGPASAMAFGARRAGAKGLPRPAPRFGAGGAGPPPSSKPPSSSSLSSPASPSSIHGVSGHGRAFTTDDTRPQSRRTSCR